jgi:hypothetical protein
MLADCSPRALIVEPSFHEHVAGFNVTPRRRS